jgi:hypothetical protein
MRTRKAKAVARRRAGMGSPSFEGRDPLPLAEVATPFDLYQRFAAAGATFVRSHTLGECSVLVTREHGLWHLSIAHPQRYPTWDEIAEARYRLLPGDVTAALILPPKGQYINFHKNCFQVLEIKGGQA